EGAPLAKQACRLQHLRIVAAHVKEHGRIARLNIQDLIGSGRHAAVEAPNARPYQAQMGLHVHGKRVGKAPARQMAGALRVRQSAAGGFELRFRYARGGGRDVGGKLRDEAVEEISAILARLVAAALKGRLRALLELLAQGALKLWIG